MTIHLDSDDQKFFCLVMMALKLIALVKGEILPGELRVGVFGAPFSSSPFRVTRQSPIPRGFRFGSHPSAASPRPTRGDFAECEEEDRDHCRQEAELHIH